MKINVNIISAISLFAAFCSPAAGAGLAGQAAALKTSFGMLSAPAISAKLITPSPARAESSPAWIKAVKAAYERAQDEGGLTYYAAEPELPEAARAQLEQDGLEMGPGSSSEAFKITIDGKNAYVIQHYIHGDTLRVTIFDGYGEKIAAGAGTEDTEFAWLPL